MELNGVSSRLRRLYEEMIVLLPSSATMLRQYAAYLQESGGEGTQRIQELLTRADRLEETNSRRNKRVERAFVFGKELSESMQTVADDSTAVATLAGGAHSMGTITSVSPSLCSMLGVQAHAVIGQSSGVLFPPPLQDVPGGALAELMKSYDSGFAERALCNLGGGDGVRGSPGGSHAVDVEGAGGGQMSEGSVPFRVLQSHMHGLEPRLALVEHSNGGVLPVRMQVSEAPPTRATAEPRFTLVLERCPTMESFLIADLAEYRLLSGSSSALALLGVSASQLKGTSVLLQSCLTSPRGAKARKHKPNNRVLMSGSSRSSADTGKS